MNLDQLRIAPGGTVDLKRRAADKTFGLSKEKCAKGNDDRVARLSALHDLLYAENKRALLIVLQGMDTSGKDGTIRHVMSGVNPQGCVVSQFKEPGRVELAHDYLWRVHAAVPPKGTVGIFNRSHYEDVLIARVHGLVPKSVWRARYGQINAFEKLLSENGVHILKFFLHVSSAEQARRFEERLADPRKNWKASAADFHEREFWDDYQRAYEDALEKCSTAHAPWYVIPADHKWFRNYAVGEIVIRELERFGMAFPKIDKAALEAAQEAQRRLMPAAKVGSRRRGR